MSKLYLRHDRSRRYHDRASVARQYDSIYDDPYWAFHDELTSLAGDQTASAARDVIANAPISVAARASGD